MTKYGKLRNNTYSTIPKFCPSVNSKLVKVTNMTKFHLKV